MSGLARRVPSTALSRVLVGQRRLLADSASQTDSDLPRPLKPLEKVRKYKKPRDPYKEAQLQFGIPHEERVKKQWDERSLYWNDPRLKGNPLFRNHKYPGLGQDYTNMTTAKYPPVKPKFPPGIAWGDMKRENAWKWHEYGEKLLTANTSVERLKLMDDGVHRESDWYHNRVLKHGKVKDRWSLDLENIVPRGLPLAQAATNTAVHHTRDPSVHEVDEDRVQLIISSLERCHSVGGNDIATLMELIQCLCADMLPDVQLDPSTRVSALWSRIGWVDDESFPVIECMEEDIKDGHDESGARFRTAFRLCHLLRDTSPLTPLNSELPSSAEIPLWPYSPSYCAEEASDDQSVEWLSGHGEADSAVFCRLGVYDMSSTWSRLQAEGYDDETLASFVTRAGVLTGFTHTYATAMRTGFSQHHEVAYPFVSQMLIVTGSEVTPVTYQLNGSSLHLSTATPNLCLVEPTESLRSHNGELNRQLVRRIISMATRPSFSPECGLRPLLPEEPSPLKPLIPVRVEVVVEEQEEDNFWAV